MNKLLLYHVLILLFSITQTVNSQSTFNGWLGSFNTIKTGKKTSLHLDVQLRSGDKWKEVNTFLARPGINYHINKSMIITVGYAYIRNRTTKNGVTDFVPEHRAWEQFTINHKLKTVAVMHRFRLEQRFHAKTIVQGNELETDGYETSGRFRYAIRNVIPLKKFNSFDKGTFFTLQNELFLNVFDKQNANNAFFDQNRFFAAIGYRFSPKMDLEIGYMNQYVKGSDGQKTTNNILQLAGYLRL